MEFNKKLLILSIDELFSEKEAEIEELKNEIDRSQIEYTKKKLEYEYEKENGLEDKATISEMWMKKKRQECLEIVRTNEEKIKQITRELAYLQERKIEAQ